MAERSSNRDQPSITVTAELAAELNRELLPRIPSAGGFRTLMFGISVRGNLQIISSPMTRVTAKYGQHSMDLLNLEAGTLAAYANLYLMTQGFQVRYIYTGTPAAQSTKLLLTLAVSRSRPDVA